MRNRLFNILIWLLLMAPLSGCLAPSPPTRISGDLDGRHVWQGRIEITGDAVFAVGSELVILPGSEVVFMPATADQDRWREHPNFVGSELIVHGRIEALGTPTAPIIFRAADPLAGAGAWGGINLVESPSADFAYCRFTQADSALHSQHSQVFVQQCRFDHNRVGIRFHSTDILVERNTLQANGTAIRFHEGAPVICLNEISGNERGLFLTSYPRDYLIENNRIHGNRLGNVILGEEVPDDVTLSGNDWGNTDPAVIATTFYDGRRDDWLGNVLFEPLRTLPAAGVGAEWNR